MGTRDLGTTPEKDIVRLSVGVFGKEGKGSQEPKERDQRTEVELGNQEKGGEPQKRRRMCEVLLWSHTCLFMSMCVCSSVWELAYLYVHPCNTHTLVSFISRAN